VGFCVFNDLNLITPLSFLAFVKGAYQNAISSIYFLSLIR